jgi:hypothetical protein
MTETTATVTPAVATGTILMLDPVVSSPTIDRGAPPRLATLDGKVIGLYSNTKLNATKVLEMAAEIVRERFTPSNFVLVESNVELGHAMTDEEHWRQPVDVALVAIGD